MSTFLIIRKKMQNLLIENNQCAKVFNLNKNYNFFCSFNHQL